MARFGLLLVALIGIIGWLLSLVFRTGPERNALITSAILAVVVQIAAFGIIKLLGKQNTLVAWGMGAILRGTVLAVYGLVFVRLLQMPPTAALISFAVFLFSSMLLESLLLVYES